MPLETSDHKKGRAASDKIAAEIAWYYYVKGMNQAEIATMKGLSRPTVISHLKHARASNLVTIRLDPFHHRMNDLAYRLKDAFDLSEVHVVPAEGLRDAELTQQVSEVAAHLLPKFVQPGDQLGVAWGETLSYLAGAVPHWPIADLNVRQLIGSMSNPALMTAENCTTDIARALDGTCVNLNAPAVVSSSALARQLRAEPIIADQLHQLKACNKSLYSLSLCLPNSHVVQFNVATEEDVQDYAARGAVCNFVGRFLDKSGQQVVGAYDDRVMAAEVEDLRKMAGMLVIAGDVKAQAALAALRGGFVSSLVLDDVLAQAILDQL